MAGKGNVVFRVDDKVLKEVIRNTPEQVDKFLRSLASEMVTEIKLSMGTSPDGREYPRGEKTHIASISPYPPNVDTDTLRGSIRWRPEGEARYIIEDGVEYGIYLEDGTERMGPRPFMRPVFEQYSRDFGRLAREFGMIKT